ncbi:WGR domain-containing protein [uncultured Tenacibaculum sp.]|uniref:WGR domain-containing protein n=1 Tax=uncultured Tenacibaculum sp. TaxID=174713 RepID=UPI002603B0C2|nr:WGR domain-containing protein [uncultured Tenacibaculum sp.]
MKLIKQKTLYFSEGKSDKVYEVDLCESQELFVVNFRYGRRGANLREGTKTVFPVSLEEAESIFSKLVESKEKKGYSEDLGTIKEVHKEENTIQKDTILKYLKQALSGTYTRSWKVSKIISRTTVLQIKEAVPLVSQFITSKDEFEQYNAIAALSHFEVSEYTSTILKVLKEKKFQTITGRIASAYILKFGSASEKEELHELVKEYITSEQIQNLPMQLLGEKPRDPMLLYYAYLFSYKETAYREQLYSIVEQLPLKVNIFKSIRYMYRTSVITEDAMFFGLLSKRMAVSNAGYTSDYFYVGNQWVSAQEEKQKKNPGVAFSGKTKQYFIKNSYKKIYNLSIAKKESYVKFATGMLCALNDDNDRVSERVDYNYNYNSETRRYETVKSFYPAYSNYLGLMYVLYGNSNRFSDQHQIFFSEEEKNTASREEIFPELWNDKPEEVLYILANAKSTIAINFALRIINDNPNFLNSISNENLLKLLQHSQEEVLNLITSFLEEKYKEDKPENVILINLLKSKNNKAITLALGWLQKFETTYLSDVTFIVELLHTDEVRVINYLSELFIETVKYENKIALASLSALFAIPSNFSYLFLNQINELIGNTKFGTLIENITKEKIIELASSSSISNKLFAINLAKHANVSVYELFKDTYSEYIISDDSALRKVGVEILAHFPDVFLLENKQHLVMYCFSEYEEIRKAIQPSIHKLVKLDGVFKKSLLNQLLLQISEAEVYEGIHQNSYELLIDIYGEDLKELSKKQLIELVLSKYEFAQKLGTPLFQKRVSLSTLEMNEVIRLSDSDVIAVRKLMYEYFEKNIPRINYELETSLKIFNSNWEDVVVWACDYFDKHIDTKNWTVDMLVYVCDHVKERVQSFGRSLITKHFSEEKGLPLLLKLQEHPTKEMQFFVTNYLKEYATDNVPVILKLESYFKTTLFYINTNRSTKTRVYSFLEQESKKYKEVALMSIRILTSVLGSKTITDRDYILDILLMITETYNDIEVPLIIKEI